MFKFQKQRVQARKRFLNHFDIINFHHAPDHIVDAFYGSCTYYNRLIVSTFAYVNGLHIDQVFELVRCKDMSANEKNKMIALYKNFEDTRFKNNYYGDVRKYGKRIVKSN